jgi:hypothetical protein
LITASIPSSPDKFTFVVEAKSRSTGEAILSAAHHARKITRDGEYPMVIVPYLSRKHLDLLKDLEVSGVDLCGNGIVLVPGQLCVAHVGHPNQFSDSRPLQNPYRGRSALVGRMLLTQASWASLELLVGAIQEAGGRLSIPQGSKAVRSLEEDLIIQKQGNTIALKDSAQLLERLGKAWSPPKVKGRRAFRVKADDEFWPTQLNSDNQLQWSLTGSASISRYAVFPQGGPRQIAVSDLSLATSLLGGTPEPVASFADVELIETDEAGFFFQCETDDSGLRWASRLQTWLEMQAGDARQQAAAHDLRLQILSKATA